MTNPIDLSLGTLGRDGWRLIRDAYDAFVRRKDRAPLTDEIGGPTLGGVRTPLGEYPAAALHPARLAAILRAADHGDTRAYLELAEQMEELDLHYAGVLATRKRTCAHEPVQVVPASDGPDHKKHAELVRRWAERPELAIELFHLLDAIGKGYSVTEVTWQQDEDGWWLPARLDWRDPRWFRLDLTDLRTPLLLGCDGLPTFPQPCKFITHVHPGKSGLPVRSGVARLAAWTFMFKTFTSKDWQIFVTVYGQPLRLGKYENAASEKDRAVLWEAVRNIAADCAAIVPKSMEIAFVGAEGATNAAEIYQSRADWLNRELSKAIVGQTSTTEGQQGSHAIGRVHRQVQDDIARHDCLVVSATLSHTIVRWIVDLNFGAQTRHPWLHLGQDPAADLTQLAGSLAALVPLGLDVATDDVRDRFGFAKPDAGAPVLGAPAGATPPLPNPDLPAGEGGEDGQSGLSALLSADPRPTGPERLTATLIKLSRATEKAWLDQAAALLDASTSLDEFADRLPELLARLESARLAGQVGAALTAAHGGGIADVADEVRHG